MKAIPVMTEKSVADAQNGRYTFWVSEELTKPAIKILIEKWYEVEVGKVYTNNYPKSVRKNIYRRTVVTKGKKKAVVTLKKGKIDVFSAK